MKKILKIFIVLALVELNAYSADYLYILNDKCINDLFTMAEKYFQGSEIHPIKDSRGLILRYNFESALEEFYTPSFNTYKKIEYFLAKIENPAIIEVHVEKFLPENNLRLKNWELTTIMANNIEDVITKPAGSIKQNRINSIGYGEFLPAKNTPNNGGKNSNRVDIIILCNITGE